MRPDQNAPKAPNVTRLIDYIRPMSSHWRLKTHVTPPQTLPLWGFMCQGEDIVRNVKLRAFAVLHITLTVRMFYPSSLLK